MFPHFLPGLCALAHRRLPWPVPARSHGALASLVVLGPVLREPDDSMSPAEWRLCVQQLKEASHRAGLVLHLLLLSLDRLPGPQPLMVQELIANMLGVRREGVTVAALKPQRLGPIG